LGSARWRTRAARKVARERAHGLAREPGRSAAQAPLGAARGGAPSSPSPSAFANAWLAEVGTGRLLPWFAVAFGAGVVLYFTAEREPAWWAASGLMAAGAIAAVLLRRHPVAFVLGLGFFAIAADFAVATLKTVLIDHPVLRDPAYSVSLAGFVELREGSQKTEPRAAGRRGMAPPAGAFVEVKAQLNPPLQPLRPDGRLAFHHAGGDAFAIHEWLAADSDGRDARDPGLGNGISCDPSGCIGKLADGRLVAYALGLPARNTHRGDARGPARLCRDRDRA
jgi:hypothetical protein